jgi:predicted PurR-regulated permease PerM
MTEPASVPPSIRPGNKLTGPEIALVAGGLALLLVLLYEIRDFLNPILLGFAGLIMLWPLRGQRTVRYLLLSGGFLLLFWLFNRLSGVLLPFVIAYLLAYLFNPVVNLLDRRFRIPRWIPSLLVTLLIVGAGVLIGLVVIPNLVGQLETLANRVFEGLGNLQTWLVTSPVLDRLQEAGLIDKQELVTQVMELVRQQTSLLAGSIPQATQTVVRSLGSLLAAITVLTLMPILLFYTLTDYYYLQERLILLFPTVRGRREYLWKAGNIMGAYLRGQLTVSAIVALIVSTALLILHIPFALLIGLLAGLLNMIPNVGIIATYAIGVILMLLFGEPWQALVVVTVLAGESFLEQSVLSPYILGQTVGLHPVVIMLSLFVFGYLMGIGGLFIAVPLAALIATGYRAYREELTLELSTRSSSPTTAPEAALDQPAAAPQPPPAA